MTDPNSLRAADLKQIFAVYGHFYRMTVAGQSLPCRSLLELVAHEVMPTDPNQLAAREPDLLVVMMNPGSSRPLDKDYHPPSITHWQACDQSRTWVETRPDNTQYQIMRLMVAKGFRHARVFNLSDLREPKSPRLFKQIEALGKIEAGTGHSLFSPLRQEECRRLLGANCSRPVILGWGRHRSLIPLAQWALDRLAGRPLFGVSVDNHPHLYAHPSPMLQRAKERWVDQVLDQMSPSINISDRPMPPEDMDLCPARHHDNPLEV